MHVAESSFPPSVKERKKERTVVAEKGGWSNKNFWNKEAVGVSFSRKERVGILGRNKLEFLWMWNSLRLNNVIHVWCMGWWLCIYVVYKFLKKNKFRIVIVIAIISLFSFPTFFGKYYILISWKVSIFIFILKLYVIFILKQKYSYRLLFLKYFYNIYQ